ncbi:ATP-grasp domain-containing protein [Arachidicoccus sp.]|uniref:ATP-grasp domain-containing protein n=1 Tax=Arachidicoccus sp. TaxID=1872624 RepID=UPI003D24323F
MNKVFNVLVFPCGSEIGLEIYRSLKYSRHINLIGANSTDDHGKFIYPNYIEGLPFVKDPTFISALAKIIKEKDIDAVYPTMDFVIAFLKERENLLGCKVIAPPVQTTIICNSKLATYDHFKGLIKLPLLFRTVNEIYRFPVFMKPDVGYGSRGAKLIHNKKEVIKHQNDYPDSIILEYLPGEEYTVDCFSNSKGELLYFQARKRGRISKGISVNTFPVYSRTEAFSFFAHRINERLSFQGAWFFQVKEDKNGQLVLLEIASRLAGSSSLSRNLGVNFAMLSVFNCFDIPVGIIKNNYFIELDRALDNKYKIDIDYKVAYIDFDDCLLLQGKVNTQLIAFIYHLQNNNIERILITKHEFDIQETLRKYNLQHLFTEVIHLKKEEEKMNYIKPDGAIFIDDAYAERKKIHEKYGIPVFAPDAVESLF